MQQGGCAHKLPRLAHSWARAFVSRVKNAGHWALCADANKSQVNCPNIVENLSKASRLREYPSSLKKNLGKICVSRGLGATFCHKKDESYGSRNSLRISPAYFDVKKHEDGEQSIEHVKRSGWRPTQEMDLGPKLITMVWFVRRFLFDLHL